MYITEIAPAKHRGQLVAAFQFNLVVGILVAYLSNFSVDAAGFGNNWRLMLGIEILPAFLFLFMLLRVPRSPRWLVTKAGERDEAMEVLNLIDPTTAAAEMAAIEASNTTEETIAFGAFFSKKYRKPIIYAFLFSLFNQISPG